MNKKLKIAIVSGTNRTGAFSLKIAQGIRKFPELANADVQLIDLAQLPSEVFYPTIYDTKPKAFESWQNTIDESRGIIFCIPEYNFGMPGILKHFIDILRYPDSLSKKPIALIGITSSKNQARGAVASMSTLVLFLKAMLYENHTFISQCRNAVSENNEIIDHEIELLVRSQLRGFLKFCQENVNR